MDREYRAFSPYGMPPARNMPGHPMAYKGMQGEKCSTCTEDVKYRTKPLNAEMPMLRQSEGDCPCASNCLCQSKQPYVPAMAYVPDLDFSQILPLETAFCVGTVFSCLNLPFTGKECC